MEIEVKELSAPIKIKEYLKKYHAFSTSLIAKVKYDNVFVNGKVVHMRHLVQNGDLIMINFPFEDSENINPISIPLDIIYEDEYILAINKPRNMPVHPSRGNHLTTLAEGVRSYLNKPFVFRATNRLDRDTSGIVIIAKNQLVSAELSRMIKNGEITKKYIGITSKIPCPEEGSINAPIERECEGSIKRVVRDDGKPSLTVYKVIEKKDDGTATLELEPITGRTHQLRVHLSHIGCPLKGDFLYGERIENETYRLHCYYLSLNHPITHTRLELIAKADFS